jgi:uncharacterized membrane-anchored protein
LWVYRIGDYRVICEILDENGSVLVVRSGIGKRFADNVVIHRLRLHATCGMQGVSCKSFYALTIVIEGYIALSAAAS